jgi:transcription initiation factor TFIIA large subunit
MSNRNEVAIIYKQVIEDVLRKVRRDFVNMGVDEQVLQELQSGWEQKLMNSRIFEVKQPPPPIASQSLSTPTVVRGDVGNPASLAAMPPFLGGQPTYPTMGYVVPGSAMSAFVPNHPQPPLAAPTNIASTPTASPGIAGNVSNAPQTAFAQNLNLLSSSQRPKRQIDSDPDALGSDLDSSDSDIENIVHGDNASGSSGGENNQDEQQQPDPKENFLLCLYEKVHRTRNKWRCTFQNGILHVEGQEFVLGKINGEFEW